MSLTVPKGETLEELEQRGHTGWRGSLSGTCEHLGGCGECEPLHDRPELVPNSFLSQCETAALWGLRDARSHFVTSDPQTPLSAVASECVCAPISIT